MATTIVYHATGIMSSPLDKVTHCFCGSVSCYIILYFRIEETSTGNRMGPGLSLNVQPLDIGT